MEEIFLQHWIFTRFAFPFLLIFFIVFAILEKTKIFGENKKQLNALIAFIIGLIFIGVAFPKQVVGNLILFLTVALVVMFVALLLWGFVSRGELDVKIEKRGAKVALGILVFIIVIGAVFWATGIHTQIIDLLFKQTWSTNFWTNVVFAIMIAAALAIILGKKATKS